MAELLVADPVERLIRQGLSDLLSGLDPIPALDAAIALLREQETPQDEDELSDLTELAEECGEYG